MLLGGVVRLGPGRSRPVPALSETGDGLIEGQRDRHAAAFLGLVDLREPGRRGGGRVQCDDERRGVARDVVEHDGVLALDSAEDSRLEVVEVGPGVVREVLHDPVHGHLVDPAQTVVQLGAVLRVHAVLPDGFGLDGDRRSGVVHLHTERGAGVEVDLVPGADLDLRLGALGELGRVEGRGEVVGVVEPRTVELLPLPVDHLLDLDVGLGRVGLGLRDVPGVRTADPLAGGRHVDDRLGRVQRERERRLVAERVHEDEGVGALDCAERAGHDVVEVAPDVGRQGLLDSVEDGLDHVRGIVQLVAHLLVEAVAADGALDLHGTDRTRRVERELDGGDVSGDVVDVQHVLAVDGAEHTRLDPVEVRPDAVAEVLDYPVELDLVDLAGVVQLEADDAVLAVRLLRLVGAGLDGDRGCRGVCGCGRNGRRSRSFGLNDDLGLSRGIDLVGDLLGLNRRVADHVGLQCGGCRSGRLHHDDRFGRLGGLLRGDPEIDDFHDRGIGRGGVVDFGGHGGRTESAHRQGARQGATDDEASAGTDVLGLGGVGHDVPFRRRVVNAVCITPYLSGCSECGIY